VWIRVLRLLVCLVLSIVITGIAEIVLNFLLIQYYMHSNYISSRVDLSDDYGIAMLVIFCSLTFLILFMPITFIFLWKMSKKLILNFKILGIYV